MPHNNNEIKENIRSALQAYESSLLHDASIALLNALGYQSDKIIEIPDSDPQAFLELLAEHNPGVEINKDKALYDNWLKADVLFQLTDEELSHEASLFKDDSVNAGLLQSYLFFAIELNQREYPRGKLTAIARQLNRVFPMPVMVFIKHRDLLSIAVINRRLNKRDAEKDVLGKVTIIRDISLCNPHRGHLDILSSFALPSLLEMTAIYNFDTLHAAWEEIFNVELLNKRFYKELANWYFWALPEVSFPDDMKPAGLTKAQETDYYEKLRATGLIRLLTRLIFCWFLKEKGLVPETLFDKDALAGILKSLDDDQPSYHRAILQNLFFATLNQRMNARGEKYRVFAKDEGFLKNRNTNGVDNLYRYESLFKDPEAALEEFEDIPFLNGGLFECMDRTDDDGKKIYVDGFSRNKKKRPTIPNRFFFGEGEVNIGEVTREKRRGTEKVRGLIQILSAYKFTIVENTPIDQEIALDPELLGKVFENLLASYNEETKTTARKQTGSFYTPRPIVDYMVDETLKAHLATMLGREHGMAEEDARTGLDILFAYTEKQHPFEADEVDTLIKAIDTCKVLDPACGSGAFPMGMLHKLVYILTKLDPDNARWKQTQLDKLDSVSMREELERTFENNDDDYGRKLYLVENCLYGVDVQPIAIQLSKLRFFISLICDQKTNKNKQQNHGVRPLPNLETKFVAADTLIGLGEETQMELFKSPKVVEIEQELQKVRHDHFAVQKRQKKLALQLKDKELRVKLADELVQASFSDQETSLKLANWNPYDPHIAADYFEPLWMFDRSIAEGFDVVIGNPPYGAEISNILKELVKNKYKHQDYQLDTYLLFVERGFGLLGKGGVQSLIIPNTWLPSIMLKSIRKFVVNDSRILSLVNIKTKVFSAVVDNTILTHSNRVQVINEFPVLKYTDDGFHLEYMQDQASWRSDDGTPISLSLSPELIAISKKIGAHKALGDICKVTPGCKPYQTGKGRPPQTRDIVNEKPFTATSKVSQEFRPLLRGKLINRYQLLWKDNLWIKFGAWLAEPRLTADYDAKEKIVVRQTGDSLIATLDESQFIVMNNMFTIVSKVDGVCLPYILTLINSSVLNWYYRTVINPEVGEALAEVKKGHLVRLPIPEPDNEERTNLSKLSRGVLLLYAMDSPFDGIIDFFLSLIDACVMECYFHDHMEERDLLFHSDTAKLVEAYNPESSEPEQIQFLASLYQTANAPDHPIRNRLLRLTADSPDLLAVIKANGAV